MLSETVACAAVFTDLYIFTVTQVISAVLIRHVGRCTPNPEMPILEFAMSL